MILSREQMIDAEKMAFASGVEPATLMESAGRQMAGFVIQNHPRPGQCRVYAGKGHNGGDVLVAARHLVSAGWSIETVLPEPSLAPLTEAQRRRLGEGSPAGEKYPDVILDGLLGIGARGNPREPVAAAIREINRLRKNSASWVLAADLPSGLDAETGEPGDPCVEADATMAVGFVKSGLVADAAVNFVGRLAVASLDGLQPPQVNVPDESSLAVGSELLRHCLPPRAFDTHKGM
ncbi:MAG: NAD(P)H-hydrate epimerase, partial [Terrimicrobiaceae bacterium]